MIGQDELVSAQVLLKTAKPRPPRGFTSENVRDAAPLAEAAALARKVFEDIGFKVTSVVGNSFSISGPVRLFQEQLNTRLERESASGAIKAAHEDGSTAFELPPAAVPPELRSIVEAVTFTPPPDWGTSTF